ncbi:MAG: hypothetical protein WC315_07600 [Candidatus Omnitrophota bacterium]|jgi:hypothetical protein
MANTKISHLGSRDIALSGLGEIRIGALADGTAKPGDLVGITDADGKVAQCGTGGVDYFSGILDDLPTIAEDTAPTAGVPVMVIVPSKSHRYRVKCLDFGGAAVGGAAVKHGTAGAVTFDAVIENATLGYLKKAVADDDTVCEVVWGV